MIQNVQRLGQSAVRLVAPDGAEATVLLHGGQLISWIPAADQERLYLSPNATAAPGRAVRGGVPVIFPQFNERGPLPRHGLVRERAWTLAQAEVRGDAAIGVFRIESDAATCAIWPRSFALELTVVVSGLQLDVELAVANTGDAGFEFQTALHSYWRVDDFQRARLKGLYGVPYEDLVHEQEGVQEMDPQGFAGEIDRLYHGLTGPLTLVTALGHMQLQSDGFPDAVVWNPGPDKAAALTDLPDADWTRFVCIESAAVREPVALDPGGEWVARLSVSA